MVGMNPTRTINGVEYEIVWSGGEGLVAPRATKPGEFWKAPHRLYNKKSDFWGKPRKKIDKPPESRDDGGRSREGENGA